MDEEHEPRGQLGRGRPSGPAPGHSSQSCAAVGVGAAWNSWATPHPVPTVKGEASSCSVDTRAIATAQCFPCLGVVDGPCPCQPSGLWSQGAWQTNSGRPALEWPIPGPLLRAPSPASHPPLAGCLHRVSVGPGAVAHQSGWRDDESPGKGCPGCGSKCCLSGPQAM